jgi:hypothetical protein
MISASVRGEAALLRSDLRETVAELKVWTLAPMLAAVAFADTILFAALRYSGASTDDEASPSPRSGSRAS